MRPVSKPQSAEETRQYFQYMQSRDQEFGPRMTWLIALAVAACMAMLLTQAFVKGGEVRGGEIAAASAGKPRMRFEPSRVVPAEEHEAIEPVPDGDPKAPQNDPAQKPAGLRKPVLKFHTLPGCGPCAVEYPKVVKELGDEFEIVVVNGETGGLPVPMLTFPAEDGKTYRFDWHETPDAELFRAKWRARNPSYSLPGAPALTGASLDEQILSYLPTGTCITIEPPSPVRVTMQDGTVVSYSKINGTVAQLSGGVVIVVEAPHPTITVRKGWGPLSLGFGAKIQSVEYVDQPVQSIAVGTSRGKFRIGLLEPLGK